MQITLKRTPLILTIALSLFSWTLSAQDKPKTETRKGYKCVTQFNNGTKKRYLIYGKNDSLSSEYTFKDSLGVTVIDSIYIYNNGKLIKQIHLSPSYRFAKRTLKNSKINDSKELDTFYTGGSAGFYDMISNNLMYPKKAMKKGTTGTIMVNCIYSTEGILIDIFNSGNDMDPLLEAEAFRVLSLAEKNFKTFKNKYYFHFTIPVEFVLDE